MILNTHSIYKWLDRSFHSTWCLYVDSPCQLTNTSCQRGSPWGTTIPVYSLYFIKRSQCILLKQWGAGRFWHKSWDAVLGTPTPNITVLVFESHRSFWCQLLLRHSLGSSRWCLKHWSPSQTHGRPRLSSRLLTSTWPSLGCCRYMRNKPTDGSLFIFVTIIKILNS